MLALTCWFFEQSNNDCKVLELEYKKREASNKKNHATCKDTVAVSNL